MIHTWDVAGTGSLPPGSTTVEIVLTPDGPDTSVELFHHEWQSGEFDSHIEGWSAMLDRLVRLRM